MVGGRAAEEQRELEGGSGAGSEQEVDDGEKCPPRDAQPMTVIAKMSDDKKMAAFDRELILLKKLRTLPLL